MVYTRLKKRAWNGMSSIMVVMGWLCFDILEVFVLIFSHFHLFVNFRFVLYVYASSIVIKNFSCFILVQVSFFRCLKGFASIFRIIFKITTTTTVNGLISDYYYRCVLYATLKCCGNVEQKQVR